jgi:hypothetical protein
LYAWLGEPLDRGIGSAFLRDRNGPIGSSATWSALAGGRNAIAWSAIWRSVAPYVIDDPQRLGLGDDF